MIHLPANLPCLPEALTWKLPEGISAGRPIAVQRKRVDRSRMGKPRMRALQMKTRGWEPTLTQVAERANRLWHQDGCPLASELTYWVRAQQQLKQEYLNLVAAEDFTMRAVAGVQEQS